ALSHVCQSANNGVEHAAQDAALPSSRNHTRILPVNPCLQPKAAILRRLSKIRIIRSSAAFRRGPFDFLRRVLDVASFAVDTILGVDNEPGLRASRLVRVHHLVNAGWAIEPRRL